MENTLHVKILVPYNVAYNSKKLETDQTYNEKTVNCNMMTQYAMIRIILRKISESHGNMLTLSCQVKKGK